MPWRRPGRVLTVFFAIAVVVTWRTWWPIRIDARLALKPVPDVTAATIVASERIAQPLAVSAPGTVMAGIIPHHLLAAPLISAFFLGLARQPAPRTVVVIGPDHTFTATAPAVTSRQNWLTPDGRITTNQPLVSSLISRGLVRLDQSLIDREHGVYTPLPFIRRAWSTQVVLIAVRSDANAVLLDHLASVLDELLGPTDIVLAAVDFSHYKNVAEAEQDDNISLPVIRGGQADAALSIPVDSPPSISLLLRFAARRQLHYQELVHTNSAEFVGDVAQTMTTSYLTAYFLRPKYYNIRPVSN